MAGTVTYRCPACENFVGPENWSTPNDICVPCFYDMEFDDGYSV